MSEKEQKYWSKVNKIFSELKDLNIQSARDILGMVRLRLEQENICQKVINFNQFQDVA